MKKIIYLITLSEMGGAQKYVLDLAFNFKKNDFDVSVSSKKSDFFEKILSKNNIKFHELKHIKRSIKNPFNYFSEFFEIYKLLKKEQPDIIHLNSSKMGLIGSLAGKLAGVKKIVFTAHGWVFNENLSFCKKKFFIFASRITALFSDKIICVSSFDKKTAEKYKITKKNKLHKINNGIDSKETFFLDKKEAKEKLGLSDKKIIIGSIANFYKTKGLKYFVCAASEIAKKNKDITFVVLGDGPERENLEKLIEKLNLKARFLLPGAKKDAKKYLKAFDLFVLSSEKEGFPYVLLEAGLAEIPIITTNVGGISDLINEKNGISILSKNTKQLKNAILNLIYNEKKKELISKNLKEEILKNFSIEKMIKETKNTYK